MSFYYNRGAFWLGILTFFWLLYLYLSGNVTIKDDSTGAIYEKNKNNPYFMKLMDDSINHERASKKNQSDIKTYEYLKRIHDDP